MWQIIFSTLLLSSCQLPYLVKSAYHQMALLHQRVPIEKSLQNPALSNDEKRKLLLTQKVRDFASQNLHLNATNNYTSFVQLDRPYVTYAITAAPKWELKAYLWSFPIIGHVPYKGYFVEQDAKNEEENLKKEGFDTYLRGVSAYSTLGWFNDPITSAMLKYNDHDLVNTIIHESVHATLFIKHEADFNERLAVFLGNKGMELFYQTLEGQNSKTLVAVKEESQDEKLFADFMSQKIKNLENWYATLPKNNYQEENRNQQFEKILNDFKLEILPKMKTKSFAGFASRKINNAQIISYKTYYQNLDHFENLYLICESNYEKFLEKIKSLEHHKDPNQGLRDLIQNQCATAPR